MGYWIFSVEENEPFPEPPKNDHHAQRYYLKRLVRWAEELELKVILDLHGAPGSQNGFDNSGRMGPIGRKYIFTFIFSYLIRPFKKHSGKYTIFSIQSWVICSFLFETNDFSKKYFILFQKEFLVLTYVHR